MTEMFYIHVQNPQARLVAEVARIIKKGGVAVIPTDSGYSFCCGLGVKEAVERIRRIRNLDKKHYFTLFCRDFAEVSAYGQVNNSAFRFLKAHTPAAITFILNATKEVPKRLLHTSRRTVGIRIPASQIVQDLVCELGEPLMSVSVEGSGSSKPPMDAHTIYEVFGGQVEAVVDDGTLASVDHTTIIDLTGDVPQVIRQGSYDVS